jgi:hypothetical protein
LTLTLSEPVEWGAGSHYIRLHRANGTPTDPLPVIPGLETNELILTDAPLDFTPVTKAANQDRTRYVFGTSAEESMPCRVKSLMPRGLKEVDVVTVAEDPRVHTVDQGLLPGPGEVQDPITYLDSGGTTGGGGGGGGSFTVLFLTDHAFGTPVSEGLIPATVISFRNTGQLMLTTRAYNLGGTLNSQSTSTVTGQYVTTSPVTPAEMVIYEIRFTLLTVVAGEYTLTGTFGAWMNCNVDREIEFKVPSGSGTATVKAELRLISTGVVQEEATFTMYSLTAGGGGGGG